MLFRLDKAYWTKNQAAKNGWVFGLDWLHLTGEFDNECVAMAAFCTAFWLWCRSIRHSSSWPWAVPAALAYVPWS